VGDDKQRVTQSHPGFQGFQRRTLPEVGGLLEWGAWFYDNSNGKPKPNYKLSGNKNGTEV